MATELRVQTCDLVDQVVLARVHELQRRAYALEAEMIGCWQMPGLTETIGELARSTEAFFGAWTGGEGASPPPPTEMLGVIAIEREPESSNARFPRTRISRLAVDPAYHRRGVGLALVDFVLRRAGGTVVVSTGTQNHPARKLYERLGFELLKRAVTPDGATPLVEYAWRS